MNLPNFITFARICSVPLIVWLIVNNHLLAGFWVTLAAGLSDAADGIIAKRFNRITELGTYLDPIADKALLMCLFIALGHQGYIDVWLVSLVVLRDGIMFGGAVLFINLTDSLPQEHPNIRKDNN